MSTPQITVDGLAACGAALALTYTEEGIDIVLRNPLKPFKGRTGRQVIDDGHGADLFAWAMGLADGVMG